MGVKIIYIIINLYTPLKKGGMFINKYIFGA